MASKLWKLLDQRGRRQALGLVALSALSALLELAGASSLVLFMAAAARPESLSGSPITAALGHPSPPTLMLLLGAACMLALTASNALTSLSNILSIKFSHQHQSRLSGHLFGYYLHQPYEWHLGQQPRTLVYHLSQARLLAAQGFLPFLQIVSRSCNIVLLSAALLYLHPLITVVSVSAMIALYTVVYRYCRKRFLATYHAEWNIDQLLGPCVSDPMTGIRDVRLAATEDHYQNAYHGHLADLAQQQRLRLTYLEAPRLLLQTLAYIALIGSVTALVFVHGGGARVVAQATLYAVLAYRLLPPLQQVFASLSMLDHGQAILEKLEQHLNAPVQTLPAPAKDAPWNTSWSLSNVSFAYHKNCPVFTDLNLTVAPNSCIGIVGPSGQGKTTLVNLLLGLLQPHTGSLTLDGQPLHNGRLRSFWQSVGYVPQDVFLGDQTILQNIAFGDPQPDAQRAQQAAELACLHSYVHSLPNGYHTNVGERGVRLSGGQRQRIGIARALYRDPAILILDEGTSALDNETEADVLKSMQNLAGTRTIIMVAHRLSSLRHCQQIYRVDGGKLHQESPAQAPA